MEHVIQLLEIYANLVTGISWPLTTILIILILRTPIELGISKISDYIVRSKLTYDAGKVTIEPTDLEQIPPLTQTEELSTLASGNPDLDPFFDEVLSRVKRDSDLYINKIKDAQKKPNWPKEDILLNIIADLSAGLTIQTIHNSIFGSQIELILLAIKNGGMINENIARDIYNKAANIWKDAYSKYTYDSWIKYLIDSDLLIKDGDFLRTTNAARAFKAYCENNDMTLNKLL